MPDIRPEESWENYSTRLGFTWRNESELSTVISSLQREHMEREMIPGNMESAAGIARSELITGERPLTVRERREQVYRERDEGFDAETREIPTPKKVPPSPISKEHELRLHAAERRLMSEQDIRQGHMFSPRGKRERQFLDLIKKRKWQSVSLQEIVQTDIPIKIADMDDTKIREFLGSFHINKKGSGPNGDQDAHFFCSKCSMDIPHRYAYLCNGHIYCSEHAPILEMCAMCNGLKQECKSVKMFDGSDVWLCPSHCKKIYCKNCRNPIPLNRNVIRLCDKCVDKWGEGLRQFRPFSPSLKWVGKTKGNIMQSLRIFSCEVEAMSADGNYATILNKNLPKETGVGQDGSVGVRGMSPWGFEIQTPRLAGKSGEELIQRLVGPIKLVKATMDDTCGMHIHLDGAGLLPKSRKDYPLELLQLWRAYIVFEDVIMSFLPFSRRRNDYCRPMKDTFQLVELDTIETLNDLEKYWYKERTHREIQSAKGHQYHSSRYFGANLHSLLAHGHFEVRFHSGTLNPKKILEWANLHALILDAAANTKLDIKVFQEAQQISRLSEKTTLLFDLVGLQESSRQYFRARQKKFGDRNNDDEEIKKRERGFVEVADNENYFVIERLQRMVNDNVDFIRATDLEL